MLSYWGVKIYLFQKHKLPHNYYRSQYLGVGLVTDLRVAGKDTLGQRSEELCLTVIEYLVNGCPQSTWFL